MTPDSLAVHRAPDPRLEAVVALTELESIARDRMAPAAFDYVTGGAWEELSLRDNEAAWRRRRFRPRVLVDVSKVATGTTILGRPAALPVAGAPLAAEACLEKLRIPVEQLVLFGEWLGERKESIAGAGRDLAG